jgi:predicted DNA-binding transcriptional regulator AlpA
MLRRIKTEMTNTFVNVPAGASPFSASQVLDSYRTAAFLGISRSSLLRGHRAGTLPKAIRVTTRKLGWRVGDLAEWLERRSKLPSSH